MRSTAFLALSFRSGALFASGASRRWRRGSNPRVPGGRPLRLGMPGDQSPRRGTRRTSILNTGADHSAILYSLAICTIARHWLTAYNPRHANGPAGPTKFRGDPHGRHHQARAAQDQRRGHQPALQLGPPPAGARHHGRRLRGARRLPPAAPLSARPRARRAGEVRPRRAAAVRRQQHPLRHLDQDRRMGPRQAFALDAADPRPGSDPVGLRLGRRPSQALFAVAASPRTARPASSACAAPSIRRSA